MKYYSGTQVPAGLQILGTFHLIDDVLKKTTHINTTHLQIYYKNMPASSFAPPNVVMTLSPHQARQQSEAWLERGEGLQEAC